MPIEDLMLDETSDPSAPSDFQSVVTRNIPTGPDDYQKALSEANRRIWGLEQKYDDKGAPRKRTKMEKLISGLSVAGTLLGAKGSTQQMAAQADREARGTLEAGMKERIAQMQTQQKRDAEAGKVGVQLEKIGSQERIADKIAQINDLKAKGLINLQQQQALLAQAKAEQVTGQTQGTTPQGSVMIDLLKAKTAQANRPSNKNFQQAYADALARGDMATASKIREASLQDIFARNQYKPIGTESTEQYGEHGDVTRSSRKVFPQGLGATPPFVPPGTATAPRPSELPPEAQLNKQYPPQLFQPGGPLSVPSQAAITPPFQETVKNNARQGYKWNWDPVFTPSLNSSKEGNKTYQGMKKMMNLSNKVTNGVVSSYVNGTLEDASGLKGTQLWSLIRGASPEGISADEAQLNRDATALTAGTEASEMGTRFSNFMLKTEIGSMPLKTNSAKGRLTSTVVQNYGRALSAWYLSGDPQQREMAKELSQNAMRQTQFKKSINDYIALVDAAKNSGSAPPSPSPNIFVMSRTDDELRKMFPTAKNLSLIRATGGDLSTLDTSKGVNRNASHATKKPKNDNAALGY